MGGFNPPPISINPNDTGVTGNYKTIIYHADEKENTEEQEMGRTITRNITTFEAINALSYIEDGFAQKNLPIRMQWDMRKNITRLSVIRDAYNEFYRELQEKYMDDEHSEDANDENGNTIRIVKPAYLKEFGNAHNELLGTENEIEIRQFNIDEFGDETMISLADMYRLSMFIIDDGENEE